MTQKNHDIAALKGNFAERLRQLSREYGSRYALSKASGIPASTLQGYEAGSKPGMEALLTLARVANVDLTWLLTGNGEIRPKGLQSGALLQDVLMVFQYELGTSLNIPMIVSQIPFSRKDLETRVRLKEPTSTALLAVEAGSNLLTIARGDIVLIDRSQANLARDGVYLLDLPGLELRGLYRRPDEKVEIIGPENEMDRLAGKHAQSTKPTPGSLVMSIAELLGLHHRLAVSKVVGRAVDVMRAL